MTPLVRINKLASDHDCEILAKCEFFNAGGSVKDRIGKRMILDAEKAGRIKPGDTLIEPTSGNTGIGLAITALIRGYRMIITLPEKMSTEKMNMLKALGAEIIRTPTEAAWDSPESHIGVAKQLHAQIPSSHILDQYENPSNPMAHYEGTAEEILYQCDGKVDMVVVGAGTGGTISGIARKLKERLGSSVTVVGVDPKGSILAVPDSLNDEKRLESYLVEGIGYDFIPAVLDRSLVDEWVKTDDAESLKMSRRLIREEGLLCGGSSGAAMHACLRVAKRLGAGKRAVVILPDSTRNYMSKFLDDEYMVAHQLEPRSLLTSASSLLHQTPAAKEPAEWWAGKTVVDLNLPSPITVTPSMACSEAAEIMREYGIDQLPVVDDVAGVLGVVTLGHLSAKILQKHASPSTPCVKLMFTQFAQVPLSTRLADFSHIFERDAFCIVTTPMRHLDSSTNGERATWHEKHVIVGVCTQVDLLKFVMDGSVGGDATGTVGQSDGGRPAQRIERGNAMDCAQMAWQFMGRSSARRIGKLPPPPSGNNSAVLSRGGAEMDCAHMAWQFMAHSPTRHVNKSPATPTGNSGAALSRPEAEMDCAHMAWEFMRHGKGPSTMPPNPGMAAHPHGRKALEVHGQPPSKAHVPSPALATTSGVPQMPKFDMSNGDAVDNKLSMQGTRFASPDLPPTKTGELVDEIVLPKKASS